MKLNRRTSSIYIPDELDPIDALSRTTHMAVSAHQDDIEIMAADGVLQCFHRDDLWFSGVVVTDGSGSPRAGLYKDHTADQMRKIRNMEQRKAAVVGEYGAQVLLDYPSAELKDRANEALLQDLVSLFQVAGPRVVYTHNLIDKHDSHVAVVLRVIQAIRMLPPPERPQYLYGCEVWRDLDWMVDEDKVAFDLSAHQNLQSALLGVFDSQISGGKRYDLATMGRRQANATYHASHRVDATAGLGFAMDLTSLIREPRPSIRAYVEEYVDRFVQDITGRIARFQSFDTEVG